MNLSNTNWNLYKAFTVAFETRNLYRASEILLVSRSAVSQNIKELERQLGVRLFTSDYKGIAPTADGANFYTAIKNASTTIINAENELHAFTPDSTGTIRIALPDHVADFFLVDYIKHFCAKYPNVRFDILRHSGLDMLHNGSVDFVIDMEYKLRADTLTTVKLFSLTDCFLANKQFLENHNLSQNITKEQLIKLPLISFTTDPWADFYKEIDPNAKPVIINSDSSSIVQLLVQKSIGIGWLSKEQQAGMNNPDIVEVKVDGFPFASFPTLTVLCAYKTISRPARVFLDGLIEFIKQQITC